MSGIGKRTLAYAAVAATLLAVATWVWVTAEPGSSPAVTTTHGAITATANAAPRVVRLAPTATPEPVVAVPVATPEPTPKTRAPAATPERSATPGTV
jgi:hypothetical protein